MPGSLLVAGATSDAGKTIVTTGICRLLSRQGVRVAPFKAQNMSNNSVVTAARGEIGRAQWIQSLAAGADPESAMNPVLLKPSSDLQSHVVVMGEHRGRLDAHDFVGGRAGLAAAAYAAYDDLASRFDAVVCEGAGGIAEINLRTDDYVNCGLAQHDSIPTLVVADIDRGGAFASLYGSLALLDEPDQALLAGFVINKFRGDVDLLQPGVAQLARLTGRPTYGVLPWQDGLWLDAEDAVAVAERPRRAIGPSTLRVAVVALPRISNFTDIDALTLESSVSVEFARGARELAGADLIVLPGSRSTLADLAWLREQGLADAIQTHAAAGRPVLGLCGGCQMLGHEIADPLGVEGPPGAAADGLGLLDLQTTYSREKVLDVVAEEWAGSTARGYLIHHGRISRGERATPIPGGGRQGQVSGTMWHGLLESDAVRRAVLTDVARAVGRTGFAPDPTLDFQAARLARLDVLADLVDEHVGLAPLMELVEHGAPAGLPFIPAGPR